MLAAWRHQTRAAGDSLMLAAWSHQTTAAGNKKNKEEKFFLGIQKGR